ncbi:MAG TPA: Gfo/Idh/MocA family oxidoreductase [Myxococcales bacterium]|jgi:predicted dehydrogenase|nr:Gfo/Idh/MocA family oxidoreductase [Myxococcales bacterium]
MRVGIAGCGLIGGKRAAAIRGSDSLAAAYDVVPARAAALAARHPGAQACGSLADLFARVDCVVVAATNDQLAPLATQALQAGKHVVMEKPGARTAKELEPLLALAARQGLTVKVGFNHRFHPAAQKAKQLLDGGACGPLMFVRARYGHGGRVGYDREWRADPAIAGGGELIDQGVHLIDLARWYFGAEFTQVDGRTATFFWKMPVDDNAFLTLATAEGQVAHLHASCTEWKNLFSFEIYARDAKLHLEGLGGSYGVERLYHYQMRPEMGPPDTVIYEYPGADQSWMLEWKDFAEAVEQRRPVCGGLDDALAALRVVDTVYRR